MRQFKVWCTSSKEWEKHRCFLDDAGGLWHSVHELLPLLPETHEVVFATDWKDKNGKLMYAGDIVTHWHEEMFFQGTVRGVIDWDSSMCCFVVQYFSSSQCLCNIDPGFVEFEVIGNTFENPEMWDSIVVEEK